MNTSTDRGPDGVEPVAETSPIDDPWQRLCRELTACEPPYPADTVRWALEQREALTPHFLALLERVSRDPAAASEDEVDLYTWAYIYLAIWRDSRAWEPMLALLRQPTDDIEGVLGDSIHETYGRALAGVCPGDVAPLRELALDASLSVWHRMAVLDAWRLRVQLADAPLEELEDVLLSLGRQCAAEMLNVTDEELQANDTDGETDAPIYLLAEVVATAGKLRSQRLQPEIYHWFEEGLVDPMTINRDDYDRYMHASLMHPVEGEIDRHDSLIVDPVEETRWWACWSERPTTSSQSPEPMRLSAPWAMPAAASHVDVPAPTTFVRTEQKVGRNDPCPCGSGKKYKKCHGAG